MDIEQENELLKHCCCFTGHRPEKLPVSKEVIMSKLRIAISDALKQGYRTFISGMAPGIDVWAAEIVLESQSMYKDINLIAAMPYHNFGKTKNYQQNLEFKRTIEKIGHIEVISKSYYPGAFQKRNVWMVNHSSLVIAVCHKENGEIIDGGTKNTIEYAKKCNKDIKYIEV